MAIEVAVIGARIFRWRFGVTVVRRFRRRFSYQEDRKSTRLNSSHLVISYAVFCLKKKKKTHLILHSRALFPSTSLFPFYSTRTAVANTFGMPRYSSRRACALTSFACLFIH